MRERQKQKFLTTLRETQPMRAARTDRDQRLHDLVTRALRIGPGIDEGRQSLHPKRSEDQHLADVKQRRHKRINQVTRPHSRGKTDRETDNRQH